MTEPNETMIETLTRLDACSEAVEFAESCGSWKKAWDACQRGDWLLWIAGIVGVDRKLVVRAACACARTALRYVPKGEDRPRIAIETAERWCDGSATIEEVRASASAASAASAAYAASAASAAYAAYAAYAASAASAAAHAAAHAAAAHAYLRRRLYAAASAAQRRTQNRHAKIVRGIISYRTFHKALKEAK